MRNDYTHETPSAVTGAVAAGAAPLPFLAIYAVIFVIHGSIKPVQPPEIGDSKNDVLIAGVIAAVLFFALMIGLYWLLSGVRRWPVALLQLGMCGLAGYLFLDDTAGGRTIAGLLVLASLASLVLMF